MIRNYGALPDYVDEIIPARCEICQEVVESSSDYGEDNWNRAITKRRLKQCRDCGRWFCNDCWDDEISLCIICK